MDKKLTLRKSISEGLSSWLTFEHQCRRDDLFSERYLALPIAQILAANTPGKVLAEHNHPVLALPGADGRPLQLDFVVEESGKITLVVETKWAGAKGVSVASVVWDCVRLELAAHYYGCDALFILAGTRATVDKMLSSAPLNPKTSRGKPSPVLGLNGVGRTSVNVQSPKRDFGPALHKKMSAYPHVKYPRSFVCGTGTQIPKDPTASAYTAAVWHIQPEAANKHFTFTIPA